MPMAFMNRTNGNIISSRNGIKIQTVLMEDGDAMCNRDRFWFILLLLMYPRVVTLPLPTMFLLDSI